MSREDDERRRAVVQAIVAVFIDHPNWRDSRVARETGFDIETVGEVRAFARSYPPIDGVGPEPKEDDTDK